MSNDWRVSDGGEAQANFAAELYERELSDADSGEEAAEGFSDEEMENHSLQSSTDDDDRMTICLPAITSLGSPDRCKSGEGHSDRDKSWLPVFVKVEHLDNPDPLPSSSSLGMLYNMEDRNLGGEDGAESADVFMSPDAHALYVGADDSGDTGEMNVEDRYEGKRNVRARVQGGRRTSVSGVRGRGRARYSGSGGGRRHRVGGRQSRWEIGHPLEEIWISDDDVPAQLRDMVRDVRRSRQVREHQMRDSEMGNVREREVKHEGEERESEDEFHDALDGNDYALLEGGSHFEWSPMETFRPQEELFIQEHTGSVKLHETPYNAFRNFWDDRVLERLVDETNWYASRITSSSFKKSWFPTNTHEILCLFAFWMMLGIVRMPTIKSCFSTDPLLRTAIFSKIFTYHRFMDLSRALHFVDAPTAVNPTIKNPVENSDRIYCLKPILDYLNSKFQAAYIPSKDIYMGESLDPWKGGQYVKTKVAKFGMKTFELCESATGYLWSFLVCTGKQSITDLVYNPGDLKSIAIVKKLMGPLLNKGYRLFMDNWYNSPLLARFLKRNGTDCVGTLRSCQDVPGIFTDEVSLRLGQFIARHSGDVCILSWQDRKRVNMISTCHGSATGLAHVSSKPGSRPQPFKPQVVLDFNRSMGGIDLKDQMLEPYLFEPKRGTNWYMKLFKRLVNVSILNARILLECSSQGRIDHLNFRLRLVDAILSNHLAHKPVTRRQAAAVSRMPDLSRKVSHTHWPVPLENAPNATTRRRSRCALCLREGRKDIRTFYKCDDCGVPLCVGCFKKYHTT